MCTHACTHKQNNSMDSILLCVLNHSLSLLKKRFFLLGLFNPLMLQKPLRVYIHGVYMCMLLCVTAGMRVCRWWPGGQARESVLTFHFA